MNKEIIAVCYYSWPVWLICLQTKWLWVRVPLQSLRNYNAWR